MFVVSVESHGKLYPIRFGAICARAEGAGDGALALAKMLSNGIGRCRTTVLTLDGVDHDAEAIVVSSVRDGAFARYVDGVRCKGDPETIKTYIRQDAASPRS